MTIDLTLSKWMTMMNLSNRKAAALIGVTPKTMNGYVNGTTPMPLHVRLAVTARWLGLPAIEQNKVTK